MESYAAVLNYAIPFFILLLLIEAGIAWWRGEKVIRSVDTLSSLSSGLTNVIKDVLGLTLIIVSYEWVEQHIGILDIKATWLVYVIAFIGIDFAGYWVHRLSHHVNYFWNTHIIHHSSEEFNLGCALRQSISNIFAITVFFLLPIAILGVPGEVVAIVAPLHLFAQYWYHTRLIGKMGFLEHVIVTPSHHRVHHAINTVYLDKNLSQIFIVWDKIFGTFQEELDEVPPVYGVTRPVRTWNPFLINFMHLWTLMQDAWRTKSIRDKFRIWFMPTGWRPADVKDKHPLDSIKDPYTYEKFDTHLSPALQWWSWIQFTVTFLLMMYLFNYFGDIDWPGVLIYGGFLFLAIFSFTTLMDKRPWALWTEIITALLGLTIIYLQGDWFLMNQVWTAGKYVVAGWFVLSAGVSAYFIFTEVQSTASRRGLSAK